MKRLVLLLFIAAIMAGNNAEKRKDVFLYVPAVATAPQVFTTDDGREIRIYNDVLQVGETYFLYINAMDPDEIIDYKDMEVFELEKLEALENE